MLRIKRLMNIILITILIMIIFTNCKKVSDKQSGLSMENISFRDIPGVTEDEIKAIEELKKQNKSFVYGMVPSTEAFSNEDGEIGGYAVLLCEWLSSFFGMRFEVKHLEWSDLLEKLKSGEVSFTGEMNSTAERRKTYYMSDPIAERMVKIMRIEGSKDLAKIALMRPLRYAFLERTVTITQVSDALEGGRYEIILANDFETVYRMLAAGKVDAFISENVVEAVFDRYGGVVVESFLPLIFSPVSLAAKNPALAPVISVVTKALRNGALPHLANLYKLGYKEYLAHKMYLRLTAEERRYIKNHDIVKMGAQAYNYPIDFYNTYEGEWQGIIFDVLEEVSALTGLSFEVSTEINTGWSDLLQVLEHGEVSFVPQLSRTPAREGRYLWPETIMMKEHYLLISRSDFPKLKVNDILSVRVGLVKDYSHTAMFHTWFPDHSHAVEYENFETTLAALEHGDVDVMMGSMIQFLSLINYEERPGYKANLVFDYTYDISPGFNKDEAVLLSIMDKAFSMIDIDGIYDHWMRKTYDYRAKLLQAQRPWLIGAVVLSLIIIALVFILLIRSRNAGKRLEDLVRLRTGELELRTEEAHAASRSKSAFLANMSHEMRTPMNVVVGLTDLMLEEDDPGVNLKNNLEKISTAGNTLLGLINDVLDISKIEARKLELMPVQYEIPSLLNDIITLNMIRIESKPIAFRLDISEDLPCSLYGDDLRVKQIINNLLSNAFKYTQKGTVILGMNCEREGDDDVRMSVWVSDTGIGIREEDLKKLFTNYSQVDTQANRRIEGTGLGLSITKMLVEHMNGEISVESEYGKGTTLRFHIIQKFVSDKAIGSETAENLRNFRYAEDKRKAAKNLVRPDLSYASVLVVDDMPNNLDVAAALLGKYKMRVDCVAGGQEAIDRINKCEPFYDAIFMDHMMPGMDGVEAATKIRAIGTKYAMTIPIIALTANAIAGNEQMFLNNDFQAFLAKPINIMSLDSIVQRWIRDKSRE